MASNCESSGLQYTVRSISLPSRLNPNAIRLEAELKKLKQCEASSVSITEPLVGLAELYNCTQEIHQELMVSSSTKQALLQHQNGIVVEESLERSVELLDSCGAIRDLFLTIKERVLELQSALRRKNGDSSLGSDINTYLSSRKKVKKEAAKRLRALKHIENRVLPSSATLDVDHNVANMIKMLREVTAITISILRSLMVFLSSPVSSIFKSTGWSLISKLMMTKSAAFDEGHALNNVECVDLALASLHGSIKNGENKGEAQMVKRQLQTLDSRIEGVEAGLESLFRQLVGHRVTLLNIITH